MKKVKKILKLPALAMLCFGIALPLASLGDRGDASAADLGGGITDTFAGGADADNYYDGGITVSAPTAFGERAGSGDYDADAGSFVYVDSDLDLTSGESSVGDSGLTTAAAWKYETPAADGKTYYAISDAFKEYETTVSKDALS